MKKEQYTACGIIRITEKNYKYVKLSGLSNIKKLTCNNLIASGLIFIDKKINVNALIINGAINIKDRAIIYANKIKICGMLVGNGRISCNEISVKFNKMLKLKSINSLNIKINKSDESETVFDFLSIIIKIILRDKKACKNFAIINNILCENISADNLIAKSIKAKNVSLGSNCIVDIIEYTDTFTMREDCIVKNVIKLENNII